MSAGTRKFQFVRLLGTMSSLGSLSAYLLMRFCKPQCSQSEVCADATPRALQIRAVLPPCISQSFHGFHQKLLARRTFAQGFSTWASRCLGFYNGFSSFNPVEGLDAGCCFEPAFATFLFMSWKCDQCLSSSRLGIVLISRFNQRVRLAGIEMELIMLRVGSA